MLSKRILILVFVVAFLTLLAGCFPSPAPPVEENQAPIITSEPVTVAKVGEAYVYIVEATDPDGDTLTYSLITKPMGMTIKSATGLIEWIPKAKGNYAVVVKASDGALDIIQSFTIVVSKPCAPPCPPAVNHAPIITSIPGDSAIVGVEYTYTIKATDQDGDSLTYFFVSGPEGMTFDAPTISWTPTEGQIGPNDVKVKVSDGKKATTQSFAITVNPVELTEIKVSPDEIRFLSLGEKKQLTVTAYYNDESEADITSDCIYLPISGIVEVEISGLVEAQGFGKTIIEVIYAPDGVVFTDTVEVGIGRVHNTTKDTYHNTIQDAIDLADSGDTIEVVAGIYPEDVVIPADKDGLQLLGAGSSVTSIIAPGGKDSRAIALGGNLGLIDGIRVQGFTLVTADFNYAFIALSGTTADGPPYTTNLELEDIVVDGGQRGICLNAVKGVIFYNVHISNITGIYGDGALELTGVSDLKFNRGSIEGNKIGVRIQPTGIGDDGEGYGPNDNIQINNSSLSGNVTFAIENQDGTTTIDAILNWWGDKTGPFHAVTNPGGQGNAVSDNVDFDPWTH